jgi:pyridoxine 5'-phosphate synthase PdxJ
MAANESKTFASLVSGAEDATVDRKDILAKLDDLLYHYQSKEHEHSDDLIKTARKLLHLLINRPALKLANPVLECFLVAFEVAEQKKHLAPHQQRELRADHTEECSDIRSRVTKCSTDYRNSAGQSLFKQYLRNPIAELKSHVMKFTCHHTGDCLSKVGSALEGLVEQNAQQNLKTVDIKALALGLRACSHALDAGMAFRADSSSSLPQQTPRKHTDSSGYIPNKKYVGA